MDTLATLFDFAPIELLHRNRTKRIHTVLHARAPHSQAETNAAAAYCLAHHTLEGAEAAARAGAGNTFGWYATHPDAGASASATATSLGARVIVAPALADLPRSAISETPYYVLGPHTGPAPAHLRALAVDAYACGLTAGFGSLLAAHAVVLCLLRTKNLGDTLDSWTISRLPGTVFMDHVEDPLVLARDLIHEGGHNWLNDALAATGCKVSDTPRFYSPWKKTDRPAFGFLHACWAFPLTMLFTAHALNHASGQQHRFLAAYLDQQRTLLAETTADHPRVLELIHDDGLRQRLAAAHRQALTL
ncbi:HEXXH motif-containing putative peptide modification protein [Streptomyces sp. H27-C3]|uniref:aKG-HExxH-type peptide beta-hydroxylase n=1 Tax=Streptomyces sp. H27-C3 TaxID=3046305 RepID=UPI0024B9FFEB|nr:HEXXH motif-containing putative peptide modification protein [Streptomyces sp. H27-C3]MDJ0466627.1 HEXXH motif-containing putative peptide modification protein [Streptomyces sp. H27-C3]